MNDCNRMVDLEHIRYIKKIYIRAYKQEKQ